MIRYGNVRAFDNSFRLEDVNHKLKLGSLILEFDIIRNSRTRIKKFELESQNSKTTAVLKL